MKSMSYMIFKGVSSEKPQLLRCNILKIKGKKEFR